MPGRVAGKVAFITGAARGQGLPEPVSSTPRLRDYAYGFSRPQTLAISPQ
jgi:hypothetical protein